MPNLSFLSPISFAVGVVTWWHDDTRRSTGRGPEKGIGQAASTLLGFELEVVILSNLLALFILHAGSAFGVVNEAVTSLLAYIDMGLIVSVPDHCLSFYYTRAPGQESQQVRISEAYAVTDALFFSRYFRQPDI